MTSPTFHCFYPRTFKGQYALIYDSEVTWEEIVDSVLHDPVRDKMQCPAIVLNRFKTVEGKYGPTVKNRYENLDHTTGWFGLDVDGTGAKTTIVKRSLFSIPEVKLCWVSSSGNGVKAIGYTDKLLNLSPSAFRTQYRIISLLCRHKSGMRVNFDQAMSRCHQPIFINSDRKALVRP